MKNLRLVVNIVVILALVCSPVLAISKADLISQYKGQSSPTILPPVPTPSHIPSWYITPTPTPVWGPVIPFPTPSPAPTQVPTGSGTGTLLITSDPLGAMVYLDGNFKGITPVTMSGISVGVHQVRVARIGYKEYSTSVSVTSGTTSSISVLLNAVSGPSTTPTTIPTTIPTQVPTGTGTGSVSVTSYLSGANVYLDGEWKGVTPEMPVPSYAVIFDDNDTKALTLTGISAGPHQLKVTKEGYLDYITMVTVEAGQNTPVVATLTRILVPVLSVTSAPPGAPVYFDGVYKGTTPIEITGISIGSHTLRVNLGGYDHSTIVTWRQGAVSFGSGILKTMINPRGVHVTPKGITYYDSVSGKPNIYLYSNRDLTAQVRLAPENAITVSEPLYQPGKGWRAEIRNGSLNGKGGFLFYEAVGSDYEWQKEEGFIIRAANRRQDMAFMLGQYNFNEKESVEFIDYWASHLIENVDFAFYPQETAAVDQDMPLYIIPEPDHVMRIWFRAEPLVSVPEPVTNPEKIIREGFYVVEWGVIIDYEYWINHWPASSEVVL